MKKIISIFLSCVLLISVFSGCDSAANKEIDSETTITYEYFEEEIKKVTDYKDTKLIFWYTNPQYCDYMTFAAQDFADRYGISVECVLKSSVDIFDDINSANINGEAPDGYIISNDLLQQAYLAGFTDENSLEVNKFIEANYLPNANNAITLNSRKYGFPLSIDAVVLAYDQSVTGNAPATIDEILTFSGEFEDTENKKSILKWDVANPYFDYMFLGNSNVLGEYGDDNGQFDITNAQVINSMEYYKSLSNYFYMEVSESSYEEIKEELKENKLVYSFCRQDVLPIVEAEESTYKISVLPDLTDALPSNSLSFTETAQINPYGQNLELSQLFFAFLTYEYAENMYEINYMLTARNDADRSNTNIDAIYTQYEEGKIMPKNMEMGDFWFQLEIAFKKIWTGSDVTEQLGNVNSYMEQRLK